MAKDVAEVLAAQKFPVSVSYGAQQITRTASVCKVEIERDRKAGDTISGPLGGNRNPKTLGVRSIGVQAIVSVKSGLDGARLSDHEELCDAVVDALYCAVSDWIAANIHLREFAVYEATYLDERPDGTAVNRPAEAVYSLKFRVPRGLYSRDFKGQGLPEGSPTATTGEIRIARNASTDPPETHDLP